MKLAHIDLTLILVAHALVCRSQQGDEMDEMDCIGAEADDTEMEFIRNISETEIVNSENLLAAFVPLIVHICSSPNKYVL